MLQPEHLSALWKVMSSTMFEVHPAASWATCDGSTGVMGVTCGHVFVGAVMHAELAGAGAGQHTRALRPSAAGLFFKAGAGL